MLVLPTPGGGQTGSERLCDNAFEDCRAPILAMIRNERVGLDVSFWMMTDWRYSSEIIRRYQAGVPVRILLDLRADANYPAGIALRENFIKAGIPIRHKVTTGINHWKMILYAGQGVVHFSAANLANGSYSYVEPYRRYVDEAIYFSDDPAVVKSFMTRYDDNWTNTTHFRNLANVTAPPARKYEIFPIDPALNFPPGQDFVNRAAAEIARETQGIDAVIFRITSGKIPEELMRRRRAGVPVRLITDKRQYRNQTYYWHSYNIDRMYMAGIPIKWKDPHHDQDVHQKSVVLYGLNRAIFGSSNWTSGTSIEHNYFTPDHKGWMVQWFKDQFVRKWDNRQAADVNGTPGAPIEPPVFVNYQPGFPEKPVNASPANGAGGVSPTAVTLRWEGGWWAHLYDVYLGTSSNPTERIAIDFRGPSSTAGVRSTKEAFTVPDALAPGTTYYWKIRGKTMLGDARAVVGPVWSFTTAGAAVPSGDVLADAYVRGGPYASTNFGQSAELVAKFSATAQYLRESYLKLDISQVSATSTVNLRLSGWLSDTRAPSVTTHIYHVNDDAWLENGLTWNTRPPAATSSAASLVVSGTIPQWYTVDLTALARAQRAAGRSTLSIVLKNTADTLPYAGFGSRESASKPTLIITP